MVSVIAKIAKDLDLLTVVLLQHLSVSKERKRHLQLTKE